MNSGTSPNDPVFYLHHANVDRIWQQWEDIAGHTSSFSDTSMPPPYQDINPNSMIDSRTLKIWYARNGLLTLDNYTVSGTENYNYTGNISASSPTVGWVFTVPNGASCSFIAGNTITLRDGFRALSGSTFSASITSGGGGGQAVKSEEVIIASQTPQKPTTYGLSDNYPNPFNPATIIPYQLPEDGPVTLKVYDLLGREVMTLVDRYENAGKYSVTFNSSNLPSGMYIYRLHVNDFISTKRMLLLR